MIQDRLVLRNTNSPFINEYVDINQGSILSIGQLDGNFIYLKGESIFSASTSGNTISFKKLNGNVFTTELDLISNHNDLLNLQGGQTGEYYHFNNTQHSRVLDLIYIDHSIVLNTNPSFGEKGLSESVNLEYTITSNDDVFTYATINNGIGNVLSDINTGFKSVLGGNFILPNNFNLSITYLKNSTPFSAVISKIYDKYTPQWIGTSLLTDFTNASVDIYDDIEAETNLEKKIQLSATMSKSLSPINEYIWFISNKSNAIVQDGNNFIQTIGTWGDGISEFYKKTLLLTLSDNLTTGTVYFYRSRETKTLTNFTYKIS